MTNVTPWGPRSGSPSLSAGPGDVSCSASIASGSSKARQYDDFDDELGELCTPPREEEEDSDAKCSPEPRGYQLVPVIPVRASSRRHRSASTKATSAGSLNQEVFEIVEHSARLAAKRAEAQAAAAAASAPAPAPLSPARRPCDLCRERRTRCDRQRPACSVCSSLALPCSYVEGLPRVSHNAGVKRPPRRSLHEIRTAGGLFEPAAHDQQPSSAQLAPPKKRRRREASTTGMALPSLKSSPSSGSKLKDKQPQHASFVGSASELQPSATRTGQGIDARLQRVEDQLGFAKSNVHLGERLERVEDRLTSMEATIVSLHSMARILEERRKQQQGVQSG